MYLQSAWINQEIFDLVHPEDTDKIRDQLSPTESPDAGRVLDLKSELVLKLPLIGSVIIVERIFHQPLSWCFQEEIHFYIRQIILIMKPED